jgi:hypothetical protein
MSLLVSGCAAPSDATTGAGAAPLPVLKNKYQNQKKE